MFRIIYGDGGVRRSACAVTGGWMGAEVLREEGWTHGTIISADPDGLVIDFGCEGLRHQLVQYGEAFSASHYDVPVGEVYSAGCAVEVLLRSNPHSPWMWRPATHLAPDTVEPMAASLALVELEMDGVMRRHVVAYWGQVRLPPSDADLRSRVIRKGQFISRTYRLADLAGQLDTELPGWTMIKHLSHSHGKAQFSVANGELIMLLNPRWRPAADPDAESEMWNVEVHLKRFVEKALLVEKKWGWRMSLAGDVGTDSAEETAWTLDMLPRHILTEMITHLDTMVRVQLRRISHSFDQFYSTVVSHDIRMTYREKLNAGPYSNMDWYEVVAPLLHCFTSRTRHITLTHGGQGTLGNFLETLSVCGQLGRRAVGQRVSVLAGQCELGVGDGGGFWGNAASLDAGMADGGCAQLLVKQCTMYHSLDDFCLTGSLPFGTVTGSLKLGSVQLDLCQLVESQVPAFDAQRMTDWVAESVRSQSPDYRILEALYNFTTPDPRKDNVYTGRQFNKYNLAGTLDVAKLSHLTRYALSRHVPPPSFFSELPHTSDL